MREKNQPESDLASLIIDALNLEMTSPADIDADDYLFGEGLGLDSIDALELSLAIKQKYDVIIRSDDDNNSKIFASLAALSAFIESNKPSK